MAKPRLKVFRTQIGFVDAIVAAPSQAAALEARGVKQNLFAEKMAQGTDEPDTAKAARGQPGIVLTRPIASKAAFSEASDGVRLSAARIRRQPEAATSPDRTALDAAEGAIREAPSVAAVGLG